METGSRHGCHAKESNGGVAGGVIVGSGRVVDLDFAGWLGDATGGSDAEIWYT